MKNIFRKNNEFLRFIFAGILNTGATYLIYLILLNRFYYGFAYTVSYLAGIIIMYFLNILFVFRTNGSVKKIMTFPLVYISQYFINYLILFTFVDFFSVEKKIAPIFVIIISMPITFILSRIILKEKEIC